MPPFHRHYPLGNATPLSDPCTSASDFTNIQLSVSNAAYYGRPEVTRPRTRAGKNFQGLA
jgi:hypothetical protein